MDRLDNYKDKIDEDELAKIERELEEKVLHGAASKPARQTAEEKLREFHKTYEDEIESLRQRLGLTPRPRLTYEEYQEEGARQHEAINSGREPLTRKDHAYYEREEIDEYSSGPQGEPDDYNEHYEHEDYSLSEEENKSPLTNRINKLRAQSAARASDVEGLSQAELELIKQESNKAFASGATDKLTEKKGEQIESSEIYTLDPNKVGAAGLQQDIDKSFIDSNRGIRDFYNHVYSNHGDKRLREKEHYLNLTPTGDVSKARAGLSKYASFDSFNAAAHDAINDGLISAMRDLHKVEREKNPKDEELAKRHQAEEKLFDYREISEKTNGTDPNKIQREKDCFGAAMKAHTSYVEERWGMKLDPQKTPNVNDEIVKLKIGAVPAPTLSAPSMAPKPSLKLKIGLHR